MNKEAHGQVVQTRGIETWYETFGNPADPALLLIMGGFCQGIMWPTEFCRQLAGEGFYVVRDDHRDSGLSTCVDYQKSPYTLSDMAQDAIDLLDYLQIEKVHVAGLSMGGPIGMLMAVNFPGRVLSLALISTSGDLRPCSLAYDEKYPEDLPLSRPKQVYLDWMHKFLRNPPKTFEENLETRLECWRILNGTKVSFEEERYREIHTEFILRCKHPESLTNHLLAISASFDAIIAAPAQVKVPTVVIQGTEDTILPPDHGEALAKSIPGARYVLAEGYGHVPNCHFYGLFIEEIKKNALQVLPRT
jgi:pimeloyl-ACP methyl ester carboxylesterase